MRMSDLSNLLGDLYRDSDQDAAPVRHEPPASERAPEWASASRLEQAFDGWAPEAQGAAVGTPDADLTAALSAALGSTPTMPAPAPAMPAAPAANAMPAPAMPEVRSTWTTEAAPAAVQAPAPVPAPAPEMAMAAAGPRIWVRGDDDILPVGGSRKKR